MNFPESLPCMMLFLAMCTKQVHLWVGVGVTFDIPLLSVFMFCGYWLSLRFLPFSCGKCSGSGLLFRSCGKCRVDSSPTTSLRASSKIGTFSLARIWLSKVSYLKSSPIRNFYSCSFMVCLCSPESGFRTGL